LSGFGDFAGLLTLVNTLDNTYCNGLTHVTDGESTERRIISECFNAHGFGRNHFNDGCITGFDEFGSIFNPRLISKVRKCKILLAGTTVNLLQEFREFAGDVSGVAIQNGSVSSADLTGVV
jgi:hypothetical protein